MKNGCGLPVRLASAAQNVGRQGRSLTGVARMREHRGKKRKLPPATTPTLHGQEPSRGAWLRQGRTRTYPG
jgi:hypothetical protein